MPDSGEIDSFFLDDNSERSKSNPASKAEGGEGDTSDDEDNGGGNPMVAKFSEDVYDDEQGGRFTKYLHSCNSQITREVERD